MIENFTLCITTYNRIDELKFTLAHLDQINILSRLRCLICDDGSSDETSEFLMKNYPEIDLIRHKQNKGLIQSRNELFNSVKTEYAIFLDDDAHFLILPDFVEVDGYFEINRRCAVLSLRVYWGLNQPNKFDSNEETHRMRSYVGCGHIWRMSAWNEIPNYPSWFKFYGEEDFASFHLFKRNWEIHYYPDILVHHRVDIKKRKKYGDYINRTRMSLRSAWYLYFMFYPISEIPRRLIYSIWMQIKLKLFKGDFKAFVGLLLGLMDLIINLGLVFRNADRLSKIEFEEFQKLPETKLYWKGKNE